MKGGIQQSNQGADNKHQDSQNNKEDGCIPENGKILQPSLAKTVELRRSIEHTQYLLSQIDTFIVEDSPLSEKPIQKATTFAASVALHLSDLQKAAKALQVVLNKNREPRETEFGHKTSIERPRGPKRLPTPEFGDLFDGNSVLDLHYEDAVYSDDESFTSIRAEPPTSSSLLQTVPSFPEATEIGSVAPLRLSKRGCSVTQSRLTTGRNKICSPFEKELRDIDRQLEINDLSQGLGRDRKPPSASSMHRRKVDLSLAVPRRNTISLHNPRGYDSSTVVSFWETSPPANDSSCIDLERQFSTEAKTRRLRRWATSSSGLRRTPSWLRQV